MIVKMRISNLLNYYKMLKINQPELSEREVLGLIIKRHRPYGTSDELSNQSLSGISQFNNIYMSGYLSAIPEIKGLIKKIIELKCRKFMKQEWSFNIRRDQKLSRLIDKTCLKLGLS